MAKLSNTSGTAIAITFLVMNLSSLLRQAFWLFFYLFHNKNLCLGFLPLKMRNNYVLSKKNEDNLYFSQDLRNWHNLRQAIAEARWPSRRHDWWTLAHGSLHR